MNPIDAPQIVAPRASSTLPRPSSDRTGIKSRLMGGASKVQSDGKLDDIASNIISMKRTDDRRKELREQELADDARDWERTGQYEEARRQGEYENRMANDEQDRDIRNREYEEGKKLKIFNVKKALAELTNSLATSQNSEDLFNQLNTVREDAYARQTDIQKKLNIDTLSLLESIVEADGEDADKLHEMAYARFSKDFDQLSPDEKMQLVPMVHSLAQSNNGFMEISTLIDTSANDLKLARDMIAQYDQMLSRIPRGKLTEEGFQDMRGVLLEYLAQLGDNPVQANIDAKMDASSRAIQGAPGESTITGKPGQAQGGEVPPDFLDALGASSGGGNTQGEGTEADVFVGENLTQEDLIKAEQDKLSDLEVQLRAAKFGDGSPAVSGALSAWEGMKKLPEVVENMDVSKEDMVEFAANASPFVVAMEMYRRGGNQRKMQKIQDIYEKTTKIKSKADLVDLFKKNGVDPSLADKFPEGRNNAFGKAAESRDKFLKGLKGDIEADVLKKGNKLRELLKKALPSKTLKSLGKWVGAPYATYEILNLAQNGLRAAGVLDSTPEVKALSEEINKSRSVLRFLLQDQLELDKAILAEMQEGGVKEETLGSTETTQSVGDSLSNADRLLQEMAREKEMYNLTHQGMGSKVVDAPGAIRSVGEAISDADRMLLEMEMQKGQQGQVMDSSGAEYDNIMEMQYLMNSSADQPTYDTAGANTMSPELEMQYLMNSSPEVPTRNVRRKKVRGGR